MPLPPTVEVKLSSEEAGTISITRVLTQELTLDELFERIVSVTGKEVERIQRILRAGTLLDSATRYRWRGTDASIDEIERQLAGFPDPDPTLAFDPTKCVEAILLDSRGRSMRLSRKEGSRRRFLRRRSFWDVLITLAAERTPHYVSYSYRDAADRYRLDVPASLGETIRGAAVMLKHRLLARQLRGSSLVAVEFMAARRGAERGSRKAS